MRNVLLVALGGALGSAARYGIGVMLAASTREFPWSTLGINVVGSLVLGAVVALAPEAGSATRLLVGVGVCGGFTTFSTFSVETLALVERGDVGRAGTYVAASVALGLLGAAAGLLIGRAVAR